MQNYIYMDFSLQHLFGGEEMAVVESFFVEGEGVGTRGGGHTPKADGAAREMERSIAADSGARAAELLNNHIGGSLARCNNGLTMWNLSEQCCHIGRSYDLKKLIRRIILQAFDCRCRIIKRNPLAGAEIDNAFPIESALLNYLKVRFIAEEQQSHDAPHIVLAVGIEELHRPAFAFGREAAEHQHSCAFGQKGLQRVGFDGDIRCHN